MGFCSGQKPLSSVKPWQSELAVLFRAVRFVLEWNSVGHKILHAVQHGFALRYAQPQRL